MRARGGGPTIGLKQGALGEAIARHAGRPSPAALTPLARVQAMFSAHGFAGLDPDALDVAVLHLWDAGACWGAWPEWAEARFPPMLRAGYFQRCRTIAGGRELTLTTKAVEAITAHAGRAIDAAPLRPCGCVICAAAQQGRTLDLPLGAGT